MKMTVDFSEVKRALDALEGTRKKKDRLRAAMKEAAKPMLEAAKGYAPVMDGDLEDSLCISTKLTPRGQKTGGDWTEKKFGVNVYVGADDRKAPHAALVEYGTDHRFTEDPRRYVGKTDPEPYMRPAFDTTAETVIKNFVEVAKGVLADALKRQSAKRK